MQIVSYGAITFEKYIDGMNWNCDVTLIQYGFTGDYDTLHYITLLLKLIFIPISSNKEEFL
jgi:hypothetical protein